MSVRTSFSRFVIGVVALCAAAAVACTRHSSQAASRTLAASQNASPGAKGTPEPAVSRLAPSDEKRGADGHYAARPLPAGDAKNGGELFQSQNCANCHSIVPGEQSVGPSLASVFKGTHVTDGDVEHHILYGGGGMPPYADQISKQDLADLLAFIHRLNQ